MKPIEELIEIEKIRTALFPAIGLQIITGFNFYDTKKLKELDKDSKKIFYLHDTLNEEDKHFKDLKSCLEKYHNRIKIQKFNFIRIGRSATYLLEKAWKTEKYFLIDKTEIKEDRVNKCIRNGIPVIGYEKQQELIIECEREKDILHLLDLFRLYSNFYEINNKTGDFIYTKKPKINKNRKRNPTKTWHKSWEIPVIIVETDRNYIPLHKRISKVVIKDFSQEPNIFIGNNFNRIHRRKNTVTPSLKDYLQNLNISYDEKRNYFCNHIFFDWLNKINWRFVEYSLQYLKR